MKFLRTMGTIAAFLVVVIFVLPQIWRLIELFWIQDVSRKPTKDFPVLALLPGNNGKYFVEYLSGTTTGSAVVGGVPPDEISWVNHELRRSFAGKYSTYECFRIENGGAGFIDVSLEVPPPGGGKYKSWYRIQNGQIIPQKQLSYGPRFIWIVMPWSVLAAIVSAVIFRKIYNQLFKWLNPAGLPPSNSSTSSAI